MTGTLPDQAPAQACASLAEETLALFDAGWMCAESVLLAAARRRGVESPLLPGLATGLCAGMAREGQTCGALTGAVMALGLVLGRASPDQPWDMCFEKAQALTEAFQARFGGASCQELLGCNLSENPCRLAYKLHDYKQTRCRPLVAEAARLLEAMLADESQAGAMLADES